MDVATVERSVLSRYMKIVVAGMLCAAAPPVIAQKAQPALEVRVAKGTAGEEQGHEQIQRILSTWDLSRWLFTPTVQIQSGVIPHSHPVLTLNTLYLANDTAQLATLVHEQLHWFLTQKSAATDSAITALKRLYPDAPAGPPEGARDLYSTYLHLIVCMLEFDAVRQVFDEGVARRTLGAWRHYPWVYRQVLERPEPIRRIIRQFGLDSPDARRS